MTATSNSNGGDFSKPLPSRGTLLCLFRLSEPYTAVETALTRAGMTLLRARNDLHAISLLGTVRPDAVLMDIPDPAIAHDPFLDGLARRPNGAAVPVIALVPTLRQDAVAPTCLKHVTAVLSRTASPEEIVTELNRVLVVPQRTIHRIDLSAESIDAVFTELGNRSLRKRIRRPVRTERSTYAATNAAENAAKPATSHPWVHTIDLSHDTIPGLSVSQWSSIGTSAQG